MVYGWMKLFVRVRFKFICFLPRNISITFHSASKTNIPIWCVFLFIFSLFLFALFHFHFHSYLFFYVFLRFCHSSWFSVASTRIYTYTDKYTTHKTCKKWKKEQTKHKRHIIKALHDNEQFHNIYRIQCCEKRNEWKFWHRTSNNNHKQAFFFSCRSVFTLFTKDISSVDEQCSAFWMSISPAESNTFSLTFTHIHTRARAHTQSAEFIKLKLPR